MYTIVNRREVRSYRKMRFWRRRKSDLVKPRLCVFRSARHIQAQVVDDLSRRVIVCASSMEKDLRGLNLSGKEMAAKIGGIVGERAKAAGVTAIVFDRNGFSYHGRIQALADAARSSGLNF